MPGCYLQLCKLLKSVNHCDIKYVSVKISGMSFSSAEVPAGYSNKNRNDKKGKRTGAHRPQHDCCSLILTSLRHKVASMKVTRRLLGEHKKNKGNKS